MSQIPPGWYPDIHGTTRWWDGYRWTDYVWAPPPTPPMVPDAAYVTPNQAYAPAQLPARAAPGAIPSVERPTLPKTGGVALWMVLAVGAVVVAAIVTVALVLVTSAGG